MTPSAEEIIEHTSPIILKTSPATFPLFLYSLIPNTIPIIEVIWPTRANNHANTIPTIPKIIGAFEEGAPELFFTIQPQPGQIVAYSTISFPQTLQYIFHHPSIYY